MYQFREMRRKERQISIEEAENLLKTVNYGVLSVNGDGGYPYCVPVNYAYADGKLYFHATSASSHKLDAIRQNEKVCFTVVAGHELVAEEFSTNYASVIVFGKARVITEPDEKRQAMETMMTALAPRLKERATTACHAAPYVMVEITPEHITGKIRRKRGTHMHLKRLTAANGQLYEKAMELYRASFPYGEQREPAPQEAIMQHPDYFFNLIYDGDTWVGLLLNWETEDFTYVEHFCILPELRNKKYGEKTLKLLREQSKDKPIILEIDPPVDAISIRRKGFYERAGYVPNAFAHVQPSYHKGEDGLPLMILSNPVPITEEAYTRFYHYMKNVIFGDY